MKRTISVGGETVVAGRLETERGTKAWQHGDGRCSKCGDFPDRAGVYRKWRVDIDWDENFVIDIDQVEWCRGENGEIWPVAILELTRRDRKSGHPPDPPRSYFEETLKQKRSGNQAGQTRMQIRMAQVLGLPLYLVVFKAELDGFYVYDVLNQRGFQRKLSPAEYVEWLRGLRDAVRPGDCVLRPTEDVYERNEF